MRDARDARDAATTQAASPTRRTLQGNISASLGHAAAGSKKEHARDFESVPHTPLLTPYSDMTERLVPPPLHVVTLGMGTTVLDLICASISAEENTEKTKAWRIEIAAIKGFLRGENADYKFKTKERIELGKEVTALADQAWVFMQKYAGVGRKKSTTGLSELEFETHNVSPEDKSAYLALIAHRVLTKRREEIAKAAKEELKESFTINTAALEEIQSGFAAMGPIEASIDRVHLPAVNVDRGPYHGGTLVGNMVQRLFSEKNRTALWVPLRSEYAKSPLGAERGDAMVTKLKPLIDAFALLVHHSRTCRVLSDTEVETSCEVCKTFTTLLQSHSPNAQINTHMIEFELPALARR